MTPEEEAKLKPRAKGKGMSHNELVFTKRAIVVVAVISSLGALVVPSVILGWRVSEAVQQIRQEAATAVSQVRGEINSVNEKVISHVSRDDQRKEDLVDRVDRLEKCCGRQR